MQGINLAVHAVKILFRDIWTTIRLTVLPMLIGFSFVVLAAFLFSSDGLYAVLTGVKASHYEQGGDDLLVGISTVFIFLTTVIWTAIGWHRFVLLEEHPGRLLPHFNQKLANSYFWAVARLALISCILLSPVLFFIPVFVGLGPLASLALSIVSFAIYALVLRFSLILPGAAVGKPMSLRQSWDVTKGKFVPIFVVAVILIVLNNLANANLAPGYFGLAVSIFLSWLSFAVGISILTTLYGVCVEKREL